MGDTYPIVKAAAVQAASVFLDREGSTAKACDLIREAGAGGARFIVLPEGFIPAHPVWFHLHPATSEFSVRLSTDLFKNSVEIPGPEVDRLGAAARDANAYVVVGVCEKRHNTTGTMYNSQIFLGPDGEYLGKHQKIMPTVGERIVHVGGYGDTLRTFGSEFGPISGLICGENSNPLAIFALAAEHTRIHAMSWPNFFPTSGHPLGERVVNDGKAFAQMTKAFVVAACGTVDEDMIKLLATDQEMEKFLRDPAIAGGSAIIGPDMTVIAGPMGSEEGILYGELDLEQSVRMKLRHDFAGHYNRPDIFELRINRRAPQIFTPHEDQEPEPPASSDSPSAARPEDSDSEDSEGSQSAG